MMSSYIFQWDNNRDVECGHDSPNTRLKGLRKITKSCYYKLYTVTDSNRAVPKCKSYSVIAKATGSVTWYRNWWTWSWNWVPRLPCCTIWVELIAPIVLTAELSLRWPHKWETPWGYYVFFFLILTAFIVTFRDWKPMLVAWYCIQGFNDTSVFNGRWSYVHWGKYEDAETFNFKKIKSNCSLLISQSYTVNGFYEPMEFWTLCLKQYL